MFGEQVRWHRRRLGLTQQDLSAVTGINVRTIGKIESGQIGRPRQSTARILADGFGLLGADRERFINPEPEEPASEARSVPAQLPPDVPSFIGRQDHLDALTAQLETHGASAGTGPAALITAIGGTAGVGKTALAVHWGQLVRDRFPDGQLYIDLRGYDPDQPVSTLDALASFLRALGVPDSRLPTDLEERAAAYRSRMADRRMLVVLDNASSVEQVRLLLPGSASCFALITSRDSLGGLVARYGARRIELDLLSLPDSITLLRSMIGERVDDEPTAATTLAEQCVRLPLALRIGAERAVARPETALATLVAELGDREERLERLDAGGDARTAVSAVFSWSYDSLAPEAARLFRLLSLHPGTEFDRYAAASLAGVTPGMADRMLDQLVRAYLVRRLEPDRFSMHDLLRAYAATLSSTMDTEDDRAAAWTRVSENYLATAHAAVIARDGTTDAILAAVPVGPYIGPDMADVESGVEWVFRQLTTMIALGAQASAQGRWTFAPRMSAILGRILLIRGRDETFTVHSGALVAARASGDRAAEARALAFLGTYLGQRGRFGEAAERSEAAVAVARRVSERYAEAIALRNLALIQYHLGNLDLAVDLATQAAATARACGDTNTVSNSIVNRAVMLWRQGHSDKALHSLADLPPMPGTALTAHTQVQLLTTIGEIHGRQGRWDEAEDYARQAMAVASQHGDTVGQGVALRDLGLVFLRRRDCNAAADVLLLALDRLARNLPDFENIARSRLGEARRLQGRYEEALALHEEARTYFRNARNVGAESEVTSRIALVRFSCGEYDAADADFGEALDLARRAGFRYDEAVALAGLGHTAAALGRDDEAVRWWRAALAIYEELAVPEADEIRTKLASV